MRAFAPGDLVDLIDEDDARLLDALNRRLGDAVHVDQLLLFLVREVLEGLRHLHLPLLRPALEQPRHHVLQVDIDLFDRRAGDDFERRERLLPDVELHDARIESAVAKLIAEQLARAVLLLARAGGVFVGRAVVRRRKQEIEQPILGIGTRLRANFGEPFLAHEIHTELHEVANHGLDVAADVADLRELRGFDLEKWRLREPRQAPGDFRLADARRADHQDVLGRDLFRQLRCELLAPQAVAKRDRDGPFCGRLTNNVLVELANDLPGRQRARGRLARFGKIDSHGRLQLFDDEVSVRVNADVGGNAHRLLGDRSRVERGAGREGFGGRERIGSARPDRHNSVVWFDQVAGSRKQKRRRLIEYRRASPPGAAECDPCASPWPVRPPSVPDCRGTARASTRTARRGRKNPRPSPQTPRECDRCTAGGFSSRFA